MCKLKSLLLTVLILAPIGYFIMVNFSLSFVDRKDYFRPIFSSIYFLACLLLILYDVLVIINGFCSVSKAQFRVVEDQVINKTPKRLSSRLRSAKPYTLVFSQNGKYGIPYGNNYRWSDLHMLNDEEIYTGTEPNDCFYLACIKKQNILVYSKKRFDLEQ